MQIILNGEFYRITGRITLHELISGLGYKGQNFAVAINMIVIPLSRYHETWLQENDKVEIVTAFQGG